MKGAPMDLTKVDLTGRTAMCGDHAPRPSIDQPLSLFTYTGPGSIEAEDVCRHCRMFRIAHVVDPTRVDPRPHPRTVGHDFEAIGPQPTDRYYCGHGGWD